MAGNDFLDGGLGRDTLNGGTGDDIFAFGRDFGNDRITDFGDSAGNEDVIQFAKAIFRNFNALSSSMKQAGADVVITATGTDVLTIKGVELASLGADDFLFV
jgi:Ca2+-binding RTX toxin-like protein